MASGMVRCAVTTAIDDVRCKTRSPRIEKAQELGVTILERMTAGEREIKAFEDFSTVVMGILKVILLQLTGPPRQRERSCGLVFTRLAY